MIAYNVLNFIIRDNMEFFMALTHNDNDVAKVKKKNENKQQISRMRAYFTKNGYI